MPDRMSPATRRRLAQARARLHAAMERALANDVANVLDVVAKAAASHAAAGRHAAAVVAADAAAEKLRKIVTARLYAVARAFIALTFEQVGKSQKDASPFDLAASNTMEWLKGCAAEKVAEIGETTKRLIRAALTQGENEGLGSAATARLIRDKVGGQVGRARAATIARTETHTAANYGSHQAAEATALELQKEWVAVEDDRTRPDHAAADGQRVGMDEPFSVGGESLMYPGDPSGSPAQTVNCRCTVLYIPKEA